MFVPKASKPLSTIMVAVSPPYTLLYGVVNADVVDTITVELNMYGESPQRLERLAVVKFADIVEKNGRIASCRVEAFPYRVMDVNIVKDVGILKVARVVAEKEQSADAVVLDVERRDVPVENVIDVTELRFPIMVHDHHVVFVFGLLDDMYVLNNVTCSKYIYSELPWKLLCRKTYVASFVARVLG